MHSAEMACEPACFLSYAFSASATPCETTRNERKEEQLDNTGGVAMSQQHAQFEEESRGEPPNQIGHAPRYELPPLSSDQVEMPDQRLQARSLGIATSNSSDLRVRTRFVLALLSLIFVFVLVIVVIANPSFVSFITVFFVVLFAVLAVFLNLIFAFGGNASPRSANKPKD